MQKKTSEKSEKIPSTIGYFTYCICLQDTFCEHANFEKVLLLRTIVSIAAHCGILILPIYFPHRCRRRRRRLIFKQVVKYLCTPFYKYSMCFFFRYPLLHSIQCITTWSCTPYRCLICFLPFLLSESFLFLFLCFFFSFVCYRVLQLCIII